jgi:RNA polymerase sigma-70 factor (ECF subfamily)
MTGQNRDQICLERLRTGDGAALEELYDRHAGLLYSVILRIVRESAEAEDVLQETWVQAWKRSASYDAGRGTVAAWLLTMARSRAIDRSRSLRSRQSAETAAEMEAATAMPAPAGEPANEVARRDIHHRVVKALETLAPQQREVLALAYFGGLSQSEISARCGAPLGTVKSWVRQGLKRLRELIPAEEEA